MSDTAIIVNDLYKKYNLGSINSGTLSGDLRKGWAKLRGLEDPLSKVGFEEKAGEYWALKGVDFEIKVGTSVGIIGKNGAGKSTLLKILSRVTTPTKGAIKIKGRIASLLEVGTGFHPDLSGRENIYMNGAILGMSRHEIKRKLEEIISFSGVDKYIDTPVKRYSSGMYVRLAFAVAAHLEPEILIVDEVLAVGDADFQRKCLGKMDEVSKNGRTVLFVSHNMAAIQSLCTKVLCLSQGTSIFFGNTSAGIATYLSNNAYSASNDLKDIVNRQGNGAIRFTKYEFLNGKGTAKEQPQSGKDFILRLHYANNLNTSLRKLKVAVGIDDEYGNRITQFTNEVIDQVPYETSAQATMIDFRVINCALRKGNFTFALFATVNEEIADWIQNAGKLEVEMGDYYQTGKLPVENQCFFYMNYTFQVS